MPNTYIAWQALNGRPGHEVGRVLLRRLYQDHVGSPLPPIQTSAMGKPCFVDSPWHFSISHSKRHAFCVLADCPVGIDAEELDRPISPSLPKKLLSPAEFAQWETSPDKNRAFLSFWVLKEASAKRTGEGIRIHPTHTAFTLPDPRIREIDGCLVAVVF